jgi:hypothetical protein
MHRSDYIPRSFSLFYNWEENMMTILAANLTLFGIRPEELAPLTALQTLWRNAYIPTEGVRNVTHAQNLARQEARDEYESAIRVFKKRFLTENPKVSDPFLDSMGFTVPKKTHTAVDDPKSAPVFSVDFSHHLRHSIHFHDSEISGNAKPKGVSGCEIWTKVGGTPPVTADELTFIGTDTRSPYIQDFSGDRLGETAYYWGRWINTRGVHGPWSEPVSAIIA